MKINLELIKTIIMNIFEGLPFTLKSIFIYPIENFFSLYYERISRALSFAKLGWLNYDFESQYIYEVLNFKLRRIYKCMNEDPFHTFESEDRKALTQTIKVVNRLFHDRYETKYERIHKKKWGGLVFMDGTKVVSFIECLSKKTRNANVITEENEELERKEFLLNYELAKQDRDRDLDTLNELLKKYQKNWWT